MEVYTVGCQVCGELHCYDSQEKAEQKRKELQSVGVENHKNDRQHHAHLGVVTVQSNRNGGVPMFQP